MRYLVGLGNYLMYDDSIGIRIIEYIVENDLEGDCRVLDISGNSLNILSYLNENTEKIVIIDAVNLSVKAGEYRMFSLDEVESVKIMSGITTHEDDMIQVLHFAQQNGYFLPEIVFMGIEPESVRMEYGISHTLLLRLHEYATRALAELSG